MIPFKITHFQFQFSQQPHEIPNFWETTANTIFFCVKKCVKFNLSPFMLHKINRKKPHTKTFTSVKQCNLMQKKR